MQGDYMALRFQVGNEIQAQLREHSSAARDGVIVATLDENRVGRFERFAQAQETLKENERLMLFRMRNGRVKFATNAFFFQEGTADVYSQARYGVFRVADDGDLLLTGMLDKEFKLLGPAPTVD
jgi:uncharacterized membrane-anchored protein